MIVLFLLSIFSFSAHASGVLPESSQSLLGFALYAGLEFVLGKTKHIKPNSTIELILKGIVSIFRMVSRKRNKGIKFLFVLCLMPMIGCSGNDVEKLKKVTAEGLGEGISKVLLENNMLCDGKAVLECEDEKMAKEYFKRKSCDALSVSCPIEGLNALMEGSKKGAFTRFICRQAIKIVMPAILPSKHLPDDLKMAKCRSNCLDDFAGDLGPLVCTKL
jgi:hypothetical protein